MEEVWKPVIGYEGKYEVSNYGNVKSLERIDRNGHFRKGKILKPQKQRNGYVVVHLSNDGEAKWNTVHRLVACAFLDKPPGCDIINHLDNNRENNYVDNLEWTTLKGNMQHAAKQGRMHYVPENLKRAQESKKRKVIAYNGFKEMIFNSISEAEERGFNHRHISSCCRGKYGYKTHKGYFWRYANE